MGSHGVGIDACAWVDGVHNFIDVWIFSTIEHSNTLCDRGVT